MGKIETLTQKQQDAIIPQRDFWLNYILSCKNRTDKERAKKGIEWLYAFCKKDKPIIIWMDSPLGCQVAANFFLKFFNGKPANIRDNIGANIRDNIGANIWANIGANIRANIGDNIGDNMEIKFHTTSYYGNIGDYGWVAYMDYFIQNDLIKTDKKDDFNSFKELLLSGVFDMIQMDGICFVSDMPVKIERNNNRLHNTNGYAVEFKDGYGQYYIHGRHIEKDFYEKCASGKLTKKEYFNEANDERRSAAYEIMGAEKMMEFLEAKLVDEVSIVHRNGEIEKISIYRTSKNLNTFKKEPYAWIKRICPSTGTMYLTPTNPQFNKAIEAAKFHRPSFVPMEIDYQWTSRS